jgi:hypothetical protein
MQFKMMATGAMLCALLVGCAAPRTPAEIAIAEAKAAVAANNGDWLLSALANAPDAKAAAQFVSDSKHARELLGTEVAKKVTPDGVRTAKEAIELAKALKVLGAEQMLPAREVASAQERLANSVSTGVLSGRLNFTLVTAAAFPFLSDAEHHRAVLAGTVGELGKAQADRRELMNALLADAQVVGPTSEEGRLIERALGKVGLRRSELALVQPVYPRLVESQHDHLFIKARLTVAGADRLWADDVRGALNQRLKGISWEPNGAVIISIERVRHTENSSPASHETVTYAQYQVNLVAAALLMPRDASYAYDIASSSSSIDYGYVISVSGGGAAPFEKVVRGTVKADSVRCSNARIQNVFGGVTAADFVANDDMASRCQAGSNRTIDDLRRDVLSVIADAVAAAPQLDAAASDD